MILVRRQVLQEPNLLFANLTDWQEANFLHNLLADFDVTWHRCLASQFGVSQSIEIVVFAHAFVMDSYYTQAMRSQKEKQEDVTAFVLSDLNP
jgi:hypothetical protein